MLNFFAGVLSVLAVAYGFMVVVAYREYRERFGCVKCAAIRAATWPIWLYKDLKDGGGF